MIINGDVIVMDNCGFQHGRNTEPQLRAINACIIFSSFSATVSSTTEYM